MSSLLPLIVLAALLGGCDKSPGNFAEASCPVEEATGQCVMDAVGFPLPDCALVESIEALRDGVPLSRTPQSQLLDCNLTVSCPPGATSIAVTYSTCGCDTSEPCELAMMAPK